MGFPTEILAHIGDPLEERFKATWIVREHDLRHCSFCGSLHPEDLLKILREGGRFDEADWKYGWPHKFYVENREKHLHLKWYNSHLKDFVSAESTEFKQVVIEIEKRLGITWGFGEKGLWYKASREGGMDSFLNRLKAGEFGPR